MIAFGKIKLKYRFSDELMRGGNSGSAPWQSSDRRPTATHRYGTPLNRPLRQILFSKLIVVGEIHCANCMRSQMVISAPGEAYVRNGSVYI